MSKRWESFCSFLRYAVPSMFLYLSIHTLAGRHTWADFRFNALADLQANRWAAIGISWLLTGGTSIWAGTATYLLKKHIRRGSSERSEMQKNLDPGRQSSGLSIEGGTSPEDL